MDISDHRHHIIHKHRPQSRERATTQHSQPQREMKDRLTKREYLRAIVLLGGACCGIKHGNVDAFQTPPLRSFRRDNSFEATTIGSMRSFRNDGHYRQLRRQHIIILDAVGTKRPRSIELATLDTADDDTLHNQAARKPKVEFGYLPDFMQKDPLAVTRQKWLEQTRNTTEIEIEQTAESKRKDNEMMVMSAVSFTLAIGVVYALASSTPEMIAPEMVAPIELTEDSENVVRDLLREGNAERLGKNVEQLEIATRNIMGTVLPQSADDVLAVSIGEGIAGVIGAVATWALGMVLNFKSDEGFIVSTVGEEMETDGMVDSLFSEAVADGDYFLTRAAAQPLLEAAGIPVFLASFASVLIATLPYEAVKLTSQKRRNEMREEILLDLLLEEEESRKQEMSVVDKLGNDIQDGFAELFGRLNVRANIDDDDFEDFIEEPPQEEQPPINAPALDYVELFADITKWLEYDVLISNYRGVLSLPTGQMLSTGWESAIFGLMAALSSQLYTDVLYLYSDFGNPLKREKTLNRSIEGWASIYATKCLSAATLFGTYEAVRAPASRLVGQLVSGGVAGCAGSKDFDLCMETYLIDNPPSAVMEALSNVDWEDNFAWLLIPFNDLDSFFSSLSNILDRILDMM